MPRREEITINRRGHDQPYTWLLFDPPSCLLSALIDLAIPGGSLAVFSFSFISLSSYFFFFLRFFSFVRPGLDGCSIILIGRAARITHRGARLWERVEVVLTFWKMAAARALSSSMTSPRNRLLRTVAREQRRRRESTREGPVRPSVSSAPYERAFTTA